MSVDLRFRLCEKLYLREPQDSKLGRRIIESSILLIDDLGFESFTFKKLGKEIGSPEASIYRYFENKHMLLVYLINWYWEWISYRIENNIRNLDDPNKILKKTLAAIIESRAKDSDFSFVDEPILHKVVIAEASKAYHTKHIDDENRDGFFKSYKDLVSSIADVIKQVDPSYKYPRSLASNLFEMINNQLYFAEHLPKLTDFKSQKTITKDIIKMVEYYLGRLLSVEL